LQGEKEDTPLMSAARDGNSDNASLLLEARADISAKNKVREGDCGALAA